MSVYAVKLSRSSYGGDGGRDRCFVYEREGTLYHAHENADGDLQERKFTISTLDHHTTLYRRDRFYATPTDLPDFVRERVEPRGGGA